MGLVLLLWKENQMFKQTIKTKKIRLGITDQDRKIILTLLNNDSRLIRYLTIVRPETVLRNWKRRLKKRWTFKNRKPRVGRPPISKEIKTLIIDMKKNLYHWGYDRIVGELKKLNISVSRDTVKRTIQSGRREGSIHPDGSWGRFIKSHLDSLFACDFLTVDTFFGTRFYVFILMRIKNRKILQFGITQNPNMGFIRNQLAAFMYSREEEIVYLVHDNSGDLRYFDYASLNIKGTSITPYSPDMNSYIERFIRSVRNECLDHFIVMNYRHLRNLMLEYVKYYNTLRPHQGIGNLIPDSIPPQSKGSIKSTSILFGLHRHYYRAAS